VCATQIGGAKVKKLFKTSAIIVMVISLVAPATIACKSATATPIGTVNAYLSALDTGNAQEAVSYTVEDFGEQTPDEFRAMYRYGWPENESYSIANGNLVIVVETETTALVSANYPISHTFADNTYESTSSFTFHITKVDGQWLISQITSGTQRTEEDFKRAEKKHIERAIYSLVRDNHLVLIPNPINFAGGVATNDMAAFPDNTSEAGTADKYNDYTGYVYDTTVDADGYVLYDHDITGGRHPNPDQANVNYVFLPTTQYYYTCESDGTVRQWSDAVMTTEYTD